MKFLLASKWINRPYFNYSADIQLIIEINRAYYTLLNLSYFCVALLY